MYAMIDLTEAAPDVATRGPAGAVVTEPPRPYREPVTEVGILAYQAAWDAGFRAEAERLELAFAPLCPSIEHVGTTAITGSAARPIIDIAVGVAKPAAVQFMIETLRGYGYRMNDRPDVDFGQRQFARWQRGLPTHHLHVVEHRGAAWQQMLRFRDVLRSDTRLAREYEWLRRRFAGIHPANRIAYARAKATFINTVAPGTK
jgi:GrpB-like predicted nucleotidyltransferase (UPF0157 family)